MAQATYKNLTKDYRNMNLMQAVGIALSSWREGFGANEYGEFDDNHKQLSINAVAKAIGERYEGVYRLEHGGGTSTVLVKYLLFIKQHDPKFDLEARIQGNHGGQISEILDKHRVPRQPRDVPQNESEVTTEAAVTLF